jgi:6-phosphogluconolactonase
MKTVHTFALVSLILVVASCGSSVHVGGSPVGPFIFTVGKTSDNLFSFRGSDSGAISMASSAATGRAPSAVVMVPFSSFQQVLYVADSASNNLTVLNLNSTTGMVAPTGITFPVGVNPVAIGLRGSSGVVTSTGSPDFGALYVLNQGANSISGFRINDSAGHVSEVPGSPFATQANPQAFAVITGGTSPTNIATFIFVANGALGTISVFKANTDGSLTEVAGSPFAVGANISAVTGRPGGTVLLASDAGNNTVLGFKIQDTGALTAFAGSPFPAGNQPGATTFSSNDFVYVANRGGNSVSAYKFDFTSSTLTLIAGSPFPAGTNPIALSTTDSLQLYVANQGSSDISAFKMDPNTGALTQVTGSPFHVPTAPNAIQTLFFRNVD